MTQRFKLRIEHGLFQTKSGSPLRDDPSRQYPCAPLARVVFLTLWGSAPRAGKGAQACLPPAGYPRSSAAACAALCRPARSSRPYGRAIPLPAGAHPLATPGLADGQGFMRGLCAEPRSAKSNYFQQSKLRLQNTSGRTSSICNGRGVEQPGSSQGS
jgi:hypothetical protein